MVTLTTSDGDVFEIKWIGVASIDGVLRFAIVGVTIPEIIAVFTDPEKCKTLTRNYDGVELVYSGYTVFRGVQINYENDMIVSLSKI